VAKKCEYVSQYVSFFYEFFFVSAQPIENINFVELILVCNHDTTGL